MFALKNYSIVIVSPPRLSGKRLYLRPEAISHDDFIAYNGEQGAKEVGKIRGIYCQGQRCDAFPF